MGEGAFPSEEAQENFLEVFGSGAKEFLSAGEGRRDDTHATGLSVSQSVVTSQPAAASKAKISTKLADSAAKL